MRIAFIHPRFPSAEGTGATHSATQIVTGLADAGHDIRVYCPRQPEKGAKTSDLELRYLTGDSRHPHTNTRLNKEVISRVDELQEFDIVHSYLMSLIPSVAHVGEDPSVKTVVTLNAYGGTCAKNDLQYLNREQCQSKSTHKCLNCIARTGFNSDNGYLYKSASQLLSLRLINTGEKNLEHIDGFQALTPHVKESYVGFGYNPEKVSVIPNVLDDKFKIEHQSDFLEPIRLLYVGSLKRSKGVDRLVKTYSQVRDRSDQEVRLTIVGDGELRDLIEQESAERGLSEQIDVTGRIPNNELPEMYSNHDIFLYPGKWNEPFGRIFLEAMAAGTPIVSTDVGSVKDIIGDAGVVTESSIEGLVDGVLSIFDTEELQKHSQAGRKRINNYRSTRIIPKFEDLYRSLML
jgi:glycosyltransferase involved in cell wall biosynthesis